MKVRRFFSLLSVSLGLIASAPVSASLYSTDFGSTLPGYIQNDDSMFGLNLLFSAGNLGSSLTVSNNGYITGNGRFVYPFVADLDSRIGGPAGIRYRGDANEAVITWESMGMFAFDYSQRYTFQAVLREEEVGIFYADGFPTERGGFVGTENFSNSAKSFLAPSGSRFFSLITGAEIDGFSGEVPEPGSLALLSFGLAGLGVIRRKRKAA